MFYIIAVGEHADMGARGLVRYLNQHDPRAISDSCDAPLRHFAAAALNASYRTIPIYSPLAVLSGFDVAAMMKQISRVMREEFGDDVFGRMLAYRHLRVNEDYRAGATAPVKYVVIRGLVVPQDRQAFGHNCWSVSFEKIPDNDMLAWVAAPFMKKAHV